MISTQAEGFAEELLRISLHRPDLVKEAGIFRRIGDAVAEGAQRVGQRAKSFNTARKQHADQWADQYAGLQRQQAKKNQLFEERVAEGIANVGNKALGATGSKKRLMTARGQRAHDKMMARNQRWEKTKQLRDEAFTKQKDVPIPHRAQQPKPQPVPTRKEQYADAIADLKDKMKTDTSRKLEELGVGGAVRGLVKAVNPSDPVAHARRMEQLVGNRFATVGAIPGT